MESLLERIKKVLIKRKEVLEEINNILLRTLRSIKGASKGIIFTNTGFRLVSYQIDNEDEEAALLARYLKSYNKEINNYSKRLIKISKKDGRIFVYVGNDISIAVFLINQNVDEKNIEKKLAQSIQKIEKILE